MHLRGLDLNLLVALDALLQEKNVTHAAKRLHVTQPSMSGALSRLRAYFGDELLVAVGRRMFLTSRAEALRTQVSEILMMVEGVVRSDAQFDARSATRTFTIMSSDSVSTVLVAALAQRIHQEAGGITLDLLQIGESAGEMLDHGDIDLLIAPIIFAPGHPSRMLFRDDYVCVGWTGNDRLGETITIDEYFELGHVVNKFGVTRSLALNGAHIGMQHVDRQRRAEVIVPSFSNIPAFIVGTRRIATMTRRVAMTFAEYWPLKILPLPMMLPELAEYIQWHNARDAEPASVWLRNLAIQVASTL